MTRAGRRGFILLEAVPALLLIGVILLLGLRMQLLRLRQIEAAGVVERRLESFRLVWQGWESGGGVAALVSPGPDGYEVVDFPGIGWLPSGVAQGSGSILWRRRGDHAEDCGAFWDVEYLDGHSPRWQWWARVLDAEKEAVGG